MDQNKSFPVMAPEVDVAESLRYLMGDTGELLEAMGGFRIKVFHSGAFPFAAVFKMLLYRDFKVYVTSHKADILIESVP